MKRFTLSLKAILILSFISIGGVPLLVLGFIAGRIITADIAEDVRMKNLLIAQSLSAEVHLFLQNSFAFLRQVEESVIAKAYIKEEEITAYLDSSLQTNGDFEAVEILDEEGVVRFMAPPDPNVVGINLSGQAFFTHVRQEKQPYWSPTFISLQTGKATLTLAIPVKEGMLVGYLDLASLNAVTDRIRVGRQGFALMIDQEGSVIAHPDRRKIAERQNLSLLPCAERTGFCEGSISYREDGRDYLASLSRVPETQWTVIVTVSADEAFEPVARVRTLFGTGAAMVVLVAVMIVLISLRKAWRPLSQLVLDTRRIADGDYALEERQASYKEIEDLVHHFHRMAEVLRGREEALRESEERYRTIMDRAADAVFLHDGTGRILDVNRKACQSLGYSREELLSMSIGEIDPEAIRTGKDALWHGILAGESHTFESRQRRKDGSSIPVEVTLGLAHLPCGPVVIGIVRDITRRKEAEENLQRQIALTAAINRVLQGALQAKTDAEVARICLSEAEELTGSKFGWIGEVNRSGRLDTIALSDTGWSFCRIRGAQMTTIKDLEIRGLYGRVLRDGRSLLTNEPSAHPDRVGLPNGHPELTAFLGVPLKQNGRTVGMVALGNKPLGYVPHDQEAVELLSVALVAALQRKRGEAERERLMAAIEQAGEMVVITDPEGTIQYVNPAFVTVTGYTREEAVGQNPRLLKSGCQDAAFYHRLWETITSGRTWEGHIINKRKDGSLYTEEATISPVRDTSGWIVNYVAVKRDISEQLRLADQFQQAQKMESVGRLAGGVAHDFNNMLGVILGYAEIALYEVNPETPLHDKLTQIRKAAQRSADLTRQLLAFARKQTIDPRVLDLNETVEGMLKMLRRLIGEDIDLDWRSGAGLWLIKMDPAQIDQILANLCVNARDAISGVGRVTIETKNVTLTEEACTTHAGLVPGRFVLLAVSDDGCGMDEETQKRLFEPFFTTKELGKGTGLGLSTVYGIVKQNDGLLDVSSEPGRGTTFRIYLPRHAGDIVETRAAGAAEYPQGRGETVLLVEDEPTMLNMGSGMLERLGYRVLTAGSPGEALGLAEEHAGKIHLLMTDVIMPEMNGRELAERLLAGRPGLQCLYMSGYTADIIAHQGVLAEGVQFIQKPFSMKDLAVKVKGMMNDE